MSFKAEVDTRAYIHAMRLLGNDLLPQVVAETLNETADAVTKRSLRYLNRRLTVRTKFTTNSLKRTGARPFHALNKARGRNVQRMFSRSGSISPYLGIQDAGGKQKPKRGSRVPIPTLSARTGKNLSKSIASRYNLGRMGDISRDGRFFIGTPKGNQGPLGLYERYQGNRKIRMIRNLASQEVTVPASRWFSDASDELGSQRFIRARFQRNARRRLQRMSNRGGA
jgi:hypothetical protein